MFTQAIPGAQSAAVVHDGRARGARAAVRIAVLEALGPAGAEAVAGAGGVEAGAGAGGGDALRVARVLRAAADAVAQAGLTAGRLPHVAADAARVGLVGVDRPAGALAAHQVAAEARSLAGDVAADPVGAEVRRALVVALADRADHQRAAASVLALMAADALAAGRADGDAAARGRVARERHADVRRARLALPVAVAGVRADDGVAVAHAGLAHRVHRVLAAAAGAVAFPVEAAGRHGRRHAGRRIARRRRPRPGSRRSRRALGDAQVLQPPVHASAQQTPSTQKPLAHSALQLHGVPIAFAAGTQGGASTRLSRPSVRHVDAAFVDGRVAAVGPGRALAATVGAHADDERKKRPRDHPPRHPHQRHFLLGQNAIPQRKFHVIMWVGTRATASCARHANDTCRRGSLGNLSGQERYMSLFAYRVAAQRKSTLAPVSVNGRWTGHFGLLGGRQADADRDGRHGRRLRAGDRRNAGQRREHWAAAPDRAAIGGFAAAAAAPAAAASTRNTRSSRRSRPSTWWSTARAACSTASRRRT